MDNHSVEQFFDQNDVLHRLVTDFLGQLPNFQRKTFKKYYTHLVSFGLTEKIFSNDYTHLVSLASTENI